MSRVGEKIDCIVTVVADGEDACKLQSDFDWLNGAAANFPFECGDKMRFVGEIVTENGYRLDEVQFIARGGIYDLAGRFAPNGPDQKP